MVDKMVQSEVSNRSWQSYLAGINFSRDKDLIINTVVGSLQSLDMFLRQTTGSRKKKVEVDLLAVQQDIHSAGPLLTPSRPEMPALVL